MDRTEAINIAIGSIKYRRAVRQADSAPKKTTNASRGRIAADVSELNAAERMLGTIRDERLPVNYVQVTGPKGVARIPVFGSADDAVAIRDTLTSVGVEAHVESEYAWLTAHDPTYCAQCAEADYTNR